MVFELWESESGHTFFQRIEDESGYRARLKELDLLDSTAHFIWAVEAENYNAAMQALYDYKSWGRYKTLEQELGENSALDLDQE